MLSFIGDLPSQLREVYDRGRAACTSRWGELSQAVWFRGPEPSRPRPDRETEAVCRLFSCSHSEEVFERLAQRSQSPLQVPFYYLELVEAGTPNANDDPAQEVKPTPEHVELAYRAILQRFPEDRAAVQHHLDVHEHVDALIAALLSSEEATSRMPALYARAFPSAGRLWHVHIPKTAGTSFFRAALDCQWGFVNTNGLSGAVGNLEQVASAVRAPGHSEKCIISGHWSLSQYAGSMGPFDRVVAFVRDPVKRAVSEFNYAVDVLRGSPNVHSADPTEFLERGLDPESFEKTHQNGFFMANGQCGFFSSRATSAAALQRLASCGGELLPSIALDAAVRKTFPQAPRKNANVSTKYVTAGDLPRQLREEIIFNNHHDFALHEIAKARYQEAA